MLGRLDQEFQRGGAVVAFGLLGFFAQFCFGPGHRHAAQVVVRQRGQLVIRRGGRFLELLDGLVVFAGCRVRATAIKGDFQLVGHGFVGRGKRLGRGLEIAAMELCDAFAHLAGRLARSGKCRAAKAEKILSMPSTGRHCLRASSGTHA